MIPAPGRPATDFTTLDQWLAWQERLHPRDIELGLERVAAVLGRMGLTQRPMVLTVGGTNGKGSIVALLEAILRAAGYRVGAYTSPHLLRYNERIRIDGVEAGDGELCAAFERVDRARGETSLTYFEFGTLAAIDLFCRRPVDVMVMEVGLGGRLDAVNVLDADGAVVSTVDLDHTDWLGPDRDTIGWEKAGIFRQGRPAVYADEAAPDGLSRAAADVGAPLWCLGNEFGYGAEGESWHLRLPDAVWRGLPLPDGRSPSRLRNAAGALALLARLQQRLPVGRGAVEKGLRTMRLVGRLQTVRERPTELLDVAHNPQAGRELAAALGTAPRAGRTVAVFAMLADKDMSGVVAAVSHRVDRWHVAGLDIPRGADADTLAEAISSVDEHADVTRHRDVEHALAAARQEALPEDRIVVFGSFHTVAAALRHPYNRDLPGTFSREVVS